MTLLNILLMLLIKHNAQILLQMYLFNNILPTLMLITSLYHFSIKKRNDR